MKRNIPLIEATMQYIEDNPLEWLQSSFGDLLCGTGGTGTQFGCKTVGCFAFHAVRLSGNYTMREAQFYRLKQTPGWLVGTADCARRELGLTENERFVIFAGNNTMPMLRLMVKDLVNGEELRSCEDYRHEAAK
jgi:hypothetical protein